MHTDARVTVCIPVWNAESFVAETLESARRQTISDIRVLVSVDQSHDGSLAICQRVADGDPRVHVVAQPERLGWVGNVNWLLQRIDTPYACLLPHDDLIPPDYLEDLLAALCHTDDAVLAFGDLETFGMARSAAIGTDLRGPAFIRVLRFLAESHDAIAWRGVFRTDAARRAGPLDPDDPAADVGWLLRLTMLGALVRVPSTRYRKRLHPDSVTASAQASGSRAVTGDWISHCLACRRVVLAAETWTPQQRRALDIACQIRLLAAPLRTTVDLFDALNAYAVRLDVTRDVVGGTATNEALSPDVARYLRRRIRALFARYVLRRAVPLARVRHRLRQLDAAWRRAVGL
jgi:glycosyltransferase involved in cell wall biosynthesis